MGGRTFSGRGTGFGVRGELHSLFKAETRDTHVLHRSSRLNPFPLPLHYTGRSRMWVWRRMGFWRGANRLHGHGGRRRVSVQQQQKKYYVFSLANNVLGRITSTLNSAYKFTHVILTDVESESVWAGASVRQDFSSRLGPLTFYAAICSRPSLSKILLH